LNNYVNLLKYLDKINLAIKLGSIALAALAASWCFCWAYKIYYFFLKHFIFCLPSKPPLRAEPNCVRLTVSALGVRRWRAKRDLKLSAYLGVSLHFK
ncbi:MAG: hypothetical protein AAF849_15465, partial [Bacteroidota bacterium]